jgi:hypothetical protein
MENICARLLVLIPHGRSKKFIISQRVQTKPGKISHRRTLVMYECENEKEDNVAEKS